MKLKQKGVALIELMMAFAIIGIITAIAVTAMNGNDSEGSMGINGYVEVRCIDGYKFTIGPKGSAHQVLSESGKGIACSMKNNSAPSMSPGRM